MIERMVVRCVVIGLILIGGSWCFAEEPAGKMLHGESRKEGKAYRELLTPIVYEGLPYYGSEPDIEMVYVPAGEFRMGSRAEERGHQATEGPIRTVHVDAFWIGKYEITQAEYFAWRHRFQKIASIEDPRKRDATPEVKAKLREPGGPYATLTPGRDWETCPATGVTPWGAQEFCRWLTLRTGRQYRLPTEAEWEYAARAGTTGLWHFGSDAKELGKYAWYAENSEGEVHPVGRKLPNSWGLYDMYGNAPEWVLDGWTERYPAAVAGEKAASNPWRPREGGVLQAARGGGFKSGALRTRSAAREAHDAHGSASEFSPLYWNADDRVGFRVVSPVKRTGDGREASLKMLEPEEGK